MPTARTAKKAPASGQLITAAEPVQTPGSESNSPSFWQKTLALIDAYGLVTLAGLLLIFVPLYPKLPLFDLIEGYIVRARMEDMVIAFTGLLWLVQLKRGKISLSTPLTKPLIAYAVVGALTLLSAVFLIQTVPAEPIHVGKSLLHYLRYLEYFFLFFVLYTAVTTRKQAYVLLGVVVTTVAAITVYGIGQKYFYWPVYSTMNREFSKGIRLYLTEHARVQSTFGGHYDLAAYLVITMPLLHGLVLYAKRWWFRIALGIIYIGGVWLVVVSGARTSFIGFIIASCITILLLSLFKKTWFSRLVWATKQGIIFIVLTSCMMLVFGQDMYDRFLQTLEGHPTANKIYHEVNNTGRKLVTETIPLALGLKEAPKISLNVEKPKNALSTEEAAVLVASDQQPTTSKPRTTGTTQKRPSDVYEDIPDYETVATISAQGNVEYITIEKERTFSDAALKHGLSLAIRLDTLWPLAIQGFLRNPLLGSGYATLNKEAVHHFTEAESTDNNFLRTLGETGLLGFITFYGSVLLVLHFTWQQAKLFSQPISLTTVLNIGLLAGTIGLLINALYIDVFAASKVAMTYWALVGFIFTVTVKQLFESVGESEKKQ
jgi:hypothetical protein